MDGADGEEGGAGFVVNAVQDGVYEQGGGFEGVGEVAAEFPGEDAGDGLGAEVAGGWVEAVEVGADG